jgi:hypothetical protein
MYPPGYRVSNGVSIGGHPYSSNMDQPTLFPLPPREGMKLIIRPWIVCRKTGKRIYPKRSRFFAFWVEDK